MKEWQTKIYNISFEFFLLEFYGAIICWITVHKKKKLLKSFSKDLKIYIFKKLDFMIVW